MKLFIYLFFGSMVIVMLSCEKYLDIKPRSNMVVPKTLDDMQQLLDNGTVFSPYPELLELQADDFYFDETYWNSMSNLVEKNAYVWERDIYGTTESHPSWSQPYSKIFYANAVLDGLEQIERTDSNAIRYDQIKGSALFLKAEAVYLLAQLFAKVYDERTADEDLGIPIPMSADVNEGVYRPSLQYTFDFITNTLVEAETMLSPMVDFSRPSKAAAHAMLARVYLYMGKYDQAQSHSNSSLELFDDIIDLNNRNIRDYKNTLLIRFNSPGNEIWNLKVSTTIDTALIAQYEVNDKRLSTFFAQTNEGKWMKQRFNNLSVLTFNGLDADEQLLIRAESYARQGKLDLALADLNRLLMNRYLVGAFVPYDSSDQEDVLDNVLKERRKELVFRALRWSDLKRLNRDGAEITLRRKLGDRVFTLPPNDLRWVLPIPLNELNLTDIPQNQR